MRKWFTSGIVALVVAVISAGTVMAATPVPSPASAAANGSPGQGLEISPPVVELNADPGQTLTTTIRVRNVTSGELIATGRADDFGAGNHEDGQPQLLLNETGATRYSLKYWVQSVPDLRLVPQELKTATITIKVPDNAEPGGHFGVVRFTAVPPNLHGTGVALSASIGTLILLKVSGVITDNLALEQFSSYLPTGDAENVPENVKPRDFFEHGPIGFLVRTKNDGSVHEKPKGSIAITDMFGKKVANLPVNDKGGNVLPGSVRRFDQTLEKKRLLGRYTAKLDLTYAGGKKVAGTLSFWVIPWKLLLLVLLGLILLTVALRWAVKRYNRYIIGQARKAR